jgi:hypothetical protein
VARLPNSTGLTKLESSGELTKLGGGGDLTRLGETFTGGEKLGLFLQSTVESFPELFGIEPSERVQEFRAANPVSGFASQAVGAFVPYLGAAKAVRAVGAINKGIAAVEGLGGTNAIARGALGAAAEAGVVEAGRLGLSATPLPAGVYEGLTGRDAELKPLSTMAGDALFNIVGGGVLGGVAGGLAARFAKDPKPWDFVPEAAPDQPIAKRARALNEVVARAQNPLDEFTIPEDQLSRLARERDQLIRFNLQDVVPAVSDDGLSVRSGKYNIDLGKSFRALEGDSKNQIAPFLNRAANWLSRPDRVTTARRLIVDPLERGGYTSERELAEDLAAIGKSREELGLFAQDIRTVGVNQGTGKRPGQAAELAELEGGDQTGGTRLLSGGREGSRVPEFNKTQDPALGRARGLQRRFTSKIFSDVGEGWRMAKEKDGLYVMAKKIRGDIKNPAPGDRWVFLRTDSPGEFATRAARTNDQLMRSAYFPQVTEVDKIGEPLFDAGSDFFKLLGGNTVGKAVGGAKNRLAATARDSLETLATYAAPSAPLATRNPLFNFGFQFIKNMEDLSEARVDQLMNGTRAFDKDRSLLRNVVTLDEPGTEGLASRIKELTKEDLEDIRAVLEMEVPFEQVLAAEARGHITPAAKDMLQALQLISDNFSKRVGRLQEAVQSDEAIKLVADFQARKGHYGLTREFPGAYRIFLNDEGGNVIGMATGNSPKAAKEAAEEIIAKQAKQGKVVVEGGLVDEALRNPEQLQAIKQRVLKPGFLKNRGDLLGYELQRGDMTPEKFKKLVETNLRRRENYIRNVAVHEKMGETLARLERESPQDAIALAKRMRILQGDEGEFARVQNAIADKVLNTVGFSGKDSASKIVRETQKLLTSFQFNFGNLTQPILNMVGTMQTILPEISYVVRARPDQLARNYVSIPLMDGKNNIKGTLGVLSEWKLLNNSFKTLGTEWKALPDDFKALYQEMVRQRAVAPRYAEEQFGANGAILKNAKDGFKDTQSFVKLLGSANEILISKSEELNRTLAVAAAYEVGKMRGLNPQQMVVFTREFLAKTAFNYGTVDRATVFTTPLGSLAGTFKNWMFHYMANMVKYATGGKEALPALFWQTAATGTIGGMAATPFISPIADGASKWLTDKPWMENLYNAVGADNERVADGLMYGLPGSLGLSFASQAASPGADPERDASMIFTFAAMDRMKALSAATRDALVAYRVAGVSPWEDENVRRELVRALAPRTFYRSMALTQDLAVRSMATGYDVTEPLGLGSALMYGAGFNPTELEKTYAVYNQLRNEQDAKREATSQLGASLAQAWAEGDDRLANRIFVRAMSLGLDTSSILRSAEARGERGEETQLEFMATPEQVERYGFQFE